MLNLLLLIVLNHSLTPGAVRPLPLTEICTTKWGLDVRHVSKKLKSDVFAAYKVTLADRHNYVIDHLVPRQLGGDDVFENLWPELEKPSYKKDTQEKFLHKQVCSGAMELKAAQKKMKEWKDG